VLAFSLGLGTLRRGRETVQPPNANLVAKYRLSTLLGDDVRAILRARWPQVMLFLGLPSLTLWLADILRGRAGVRGPDIGDQYLHSLCHMFGCIPGQFWEQAQIWMALTVVLVILSAVIVIYVSYSAANFFYVRSAEAGDVAFRLGASYYWFVGGAFAFACAVSFAIAGAPDYHALFPGGVQEHLRFVASLRQSQFLSLLDGSFYAVNASVAFAATFIVLSVALTVTNVDSTLDERLLARQRTRFNTLLYLASTVLVLGVVQMSAWVRLPLSMFDSYIKQAPVALGEAAAKPLIAKVEVISAQYQAVATGYVTFAGITFVAVLLAIFLPASKMLERASRDKAAAAVAQGAGEPPSTSVDKWLADRGLDDRTWDRVVAVVALLAPFIAAPVAQFLQSLLKQAPPAQSSFIGFSALVA